MDGIKSSSSPVTEMEITTGDYYPQYMDVDEQEEFHVETLRHKISQMLCSVERSYQEMASKERELQRKEQRLHEQEVRQIEKSHWIQMEKSRLEAQKNLLQNKDCFLMEKEAVLMRKEENTSQDISRLNEIRERQVEFERELSAYEKLLMERERQMTCQLQHNNNILKEAEKCFLELTNELATKEELLRKAEQEVLASKSNNIQSLTEEQENIWYEREKEFKNHFSMARQRLQVTEALLEEQRKNLESEKRHLVSREHQMKEYWDGKMAELGAREVALLSKEEQCCVRWRGDIKIWIPKKENFNEKSKDFTNKKLDKLKRVTGYTWKNVVWKFRKKFLPDKDAFLMEKEAALMRKEENISQDISRLNEISKRQVEFEKELSGYEKILMEKERQVSCLLQDNGNILKEAEKCLLELTNELAIKQELLSKAKKDVLASKFNDMQSLTEERENISYERGKEFKNHFSMTRQRLQVTEALLEEQWKNLESEKRHLVSREHQMKKYWDGKMAELGARENALLSKGRRQKTRNLRKIQRKRKRC
ncbi:golgin subfamily A member 6-like protein 24 [Palaemon carinicauda]|uniref:golgin subfamily A member 6-like protein 24 n=1 Tax=Palaemon carinicauda TaxID=392227 RepID=UPI0035B690FA